MPDPLQQNAAPRAKARLAGAVRRAAASGGMWDPQVETCGQTRLSMASRVAGRKA